MTGPQLSANPDHGLTATCEGRDCRYSATLDRAALVAQFGDITTDDLRQRLRCPACGHRGASLIVSSPHTGHVPFRGSR